MTDYGNYTILCTVDEKMSRELILGDSDGFHQQYHWFEHPKMNFNKSISCIVQILQYSTDLKVFWWAVLCRFLFYTDTSKMVSAVPGHSGVRRVGICHCLRGQPFPVVVLGRLELSCFVGILLAGGEVEGEQIDERNPAV